jgi:hypothetical protein
MVMPENSQPAQTRDSSANVYKRHLLRESMVARGIHLDQGTAQTIACEPG